MKAAALGLAAGLVLGFVIGGWWQGSPAQATDLVGNTSPQHDRSPTQTPRQDHARQPDRERSNRTPGASPTRTVEVDPAVLADLVGSTQPSLEHRTVLFSDGDLVARALAITDAERDMLEHDWARVKDQVLQRQRETLHHEQRDDQLWIGAAPFDGESLHTAFREAILAALGPERGEAFLKITKAEDAFGGWGRQNSAAYSIRMERQSDGSLVYRITEQASPDGPHGRSWISKQIPPHIREMTDFLGISPEARDP